MKIDKRAYPFNLILAVFYSDLISKDITKNIFIMGLYEQIKKMPRNEQVYIQIRYEDSKSRRQCGEELNLPPYEIEKLENKILAKLRSSHVRSQLIAVSVHAKEQVEKRCDELETRLKLLEDILVGIHQKTILPEELVITSESYTQIESPIALLEDLNLNVRAYNCLKRAGICTINELIRKSEAEIMKSVRGVGEFVMSEIKEKLALQNLQLGQERADTTSNTKQSMQPTNNMNSYNLSKRGFHPRMKLKVRLINK